MEMRDSIVVDEGRRIDVAEENEQSRSDEAAVAISFQLSSSSSVSSSMIEHRLVESCPFLSSLAPSVHWLLCHSPIYCSQ